MFITCPELAALPSVRHGFFTRNGGVSGGIYASLNCGYGSDDTIEHVAHNRALVAGALSVASDALLTVYQIHSAKVVTVDRTWDYTDAPQADAMVSATPGIGLGILSADCLPVLFADATHGVIGAAHSGWKGAFGGILEATLGAMAALGATPATTIAAIGPGIAQGSYEVGSEFRDRFLEQDDGNQLYFIHGGREGHYLFDLKAYAKDRLRNAGLTHIHVLPEDTCLQENDFFSYRRTTQRGESAYGRQISAIALG